MSALEEALADYLQLRRSLGHQMAEAAWLLPSFVAHLDAHGSPTVTIEAALAWVQEAATGKEALLTDPWVMTGLEGPACGRRG